MAKLRAQTVDATPSGIKLFSKVVFITLEAQKSGIEKCSG
jgi:hypothetical protein